MPGRRKQFARANKAAAKAAHEIEAIIVALMNQVATLPKVPMDHVEEQIEEEIYRRNRDVYMFLRY
jgi:hypothetical protein